MKESSYVQQTEDFFYLIYGYFKVFKSRVESKLLEIYNLK